MDGRMDGSVWSLGQKKKCHRGGVTWSPLAKESETELEQRCTVSHVKECLDFNL